jgi:hypothetical protein
MTSLITKIAALSSSRNLCEEYCKRHFEPQVCETAHVDCIPDLGLCRSMYWTNPSRTEVMIYDAKGAAKRMTSFIENHPAVRCAELPDEPVPSRGFLSRLFNRKLFSDEDEGSVDPSMDKTQRGPHVRLNKARKVRTEEGLNSSPIEVLVPVEGVNLEAAARFAERLPASLPRVVPEGEFPGIAACLAMSSSEISVEGEKEPLEFTSQAILERISSSVKSRDLRFQVSEVPGTAEGVLMKIVSELLEGLDGYTIRAFAIKDMGYGCSSRLIVEEACLRYPLLTVSGRISSHAKFFQAAVRMILVLRAVHSMGIVHNSLPDGYVWDGFNIDSIKLGKFHHTRMFVNFPGNTHVSTESCSTDRTTKRLDMPDIERGKIACISRAYDLEQLALMLKVIYHKQFSSTPMPRVLEEFIEYSIEIGLTEAPNYEEWIDRFTRYEYL